MADKIRIGIADAHFVVREGFKAVLARDKEFEVVGECVSSDCIPGLMRKGIDVLLFDFDNEGNITLDDLDRVHRIDPQVKVIMVSSHQDPAKVNRAMRQGVSGYLFKECDESEILNAVRFARKGDRFFCNRVLDILVDKRKLDDKNDCLPTRLTKRELEIVDQIVQGFTANVIAERLCLSAHTVTTHRKNIFRKLGVRSTTELVRHAMSAAMV
ncbi:MAG: response regulator transcription factor [Flavobacteriales bacterium]|nr:response regulator transcription factor [Flavobacteriales bacterium]